MIVEVNPSFEGIVAERFLALAKQLERWQEHRLPAEFTALCEGEVEWSRTYPYINGYRETYEAAARVLIDLARLSYKVHQFGYSIELESPVFYQNRHLSPEDINQYKTTIRKELTSLRDVHLNNQNIREFIFKLENPPTTTDPANSYSGYFGPDRDNNVSGNRRPTPRGYG